MRTFKAATLAAVIAGAFLTTSTLAQGGREGGPPPGERPFDVDAVVDRMMENDANSDGKLAKDEMPGRFVEQMFPVADADQDGFLTREELKTYFESRPRGGAGVGQPRGGEGGPPATFESHMRQAGQALRALRRTSFTAETQADDLTRIGVIEASLIGAKQLIDPEHMAPQAKEKYGSDTATYTRDVRLAIIKAIKAAIVLEEAIIAGDSAGSKAALEKLLAVQKQGHDQFQSEEDEEGERPEPAPGGRGGRGQGGGGGGNRGGGNGGG